MAADKGKSSSKLCSKKIQGKVSGVTKAEREKLKREHLNDLFLALANALEISEQTNGKACVIGETTRMVKDTLKQIECLKRENEALLFESQYVTSENNELQVENSALQDQIVKLQKELKEKTSQVNLDLNIAPPEPKRLDLMPLTAEDHITFPIGEPLLQKPATGAPLYVIPVYPDFQVHQQSNHTAQLACEPVGNVSKPRARYPSPGDSWPSRIL
ncbi:transcription factor bHLH47 [Daucus carota subsp. sativus]|uniref:transcription factor bHLH47 n=1 Tax=Daucus carota subsp. sativus TaxID=79200 RepID=UPI0007B27A41|nr:PREDICTED: transcription factor bHLH47-like [Daucus carota subsp. sativus]